MHLANPWSTSPHSLPLTRPHAGRRSWITKYGIQLRFPTICRSDGSLAEHLSRLGWLTLLLRDMARIEPGPVF